VTAETTENVQRPAPLPDALLALLRGAAPCFVATLMPDGSPQLTETWVDTDGEHVVINTVESHQKVRNLRRDPRVSLNVCDPDDVSRYFEVRGHVVDITAEGGWEHIEQLSQRYTGGPYQNYGGRPSVRVIVTIEADKVRSPW
jgi:PPOX class probable F420-dependent enzyme